MMPIMHGVDVLRFVRSSPEIKTTPVVILSEAYMSDLAQEAAKIGAELTLLKSSCTPNLMVEIANKIFSGAPLELDAEKMLAVRPKEN
jgi:CheY-like chemotaxis protein